MLAVIMALVYGVVAKQVYTPVFTAKILENVILAELLVDITIKSAYYKRIYIYII